MTERRPCSRCELELPPSAFADGETAFCKACMEEIVGIIRSKYSAIEAAHFRAKLRRRSREALEGLGQASKRDGGPLKPGGRRND